MTNAQVPKSRGTEEQPFDLVERFDGFELRQYPDHILVQVTATGDFLRAGNRGFRPLIGYISGANHTAQRMPMTAPVIQQPRGRNERGDDEHTVSFVLPAGFDIRSVPAPTTAAVSILAVAGGFVAARTFSGSWSSAKFADSGDALIAAVLREGFTVTGDQYFARFDPPWKPGFLKHNEALVGVLDSRASSVG